MQARTLDAELAALHDQVKELRAENARLLRLLELTPQQARPPGPAQAGIVPREGAAQDDDVAAGPRH
jgi:hypothetical protein